MRKRSRLVIVALGAALALVLSSCWQIRLVKVNNWTPGAGDVAVVTFDLYPAIDLSTSDGYPVVVVAYESSLENRGTTFDVFNNYDGKEKGTRDATLRTYMINNSLCDVGGTDVAELAAEWNALKVFRTDAPVLGSSISDTDPLRVKWRTALSPDAADGVPAPFIILTGLWLDDGDATPDSGDTIYCSSSFGNTLLPNIP